MVEPLTQSPAREEGEPDPLRYVPPRRLKLVAGIILAGFLLVLIFGTLSRLVTDRRLVAAGQAATLPVVSVVSPQSQTAPRTLVLPGNVSAFYRAPIYAQVSGYLQRWYFDIGARVSQGEILATIDTPDLDQQLAQAEADLNTAEANQRLAAITARRWNALLAKDAVSQQDADDKNGALAAQTAMVTAAKANVQRLQALESFKQLRAPFDGVVTARNTDVGALVTVGGQTPLFVVDDEHRLRIYVNVPQVYSAEVKPGATAIFTVPEYPGQSFNAVLTSTARAIDPVAGSLLVQFQTDNAARQLHPGAYAQVHIDLPHDNQATLIPASALIFRDAGLQVATLGPDNRVVLKPISVNRDLGPVVEVATGVTRDDKIIDNPPDSLEQGDRVQIAPAQGAHG